MEHFAIAPELHGHDLVVMTWPEPWEKERYDRFFSYLRYTVMTDCL